MKSKAAMADITITVQTKEGPKTSEAIVDTGGETEHVVHDKVARLVLSHDFEGIK
jgi:hypothetical protein